ncbi:MAG: radical SAM protein [Desulfobacterales bacterium]|nr:radical SAM protein [Desulfobacterales bacterium]
MKIKETYEKGIIIKDKKTRIKIALIYPNAYQLGMANLGFQSVYRIFSNVENVVCERAFFDIEILKKEKKIVTKETGYALKEFDIIAFSISFENDYINVLKILKNAGMLLESKSRLLPPLVIAGGAACIINPEPIASFIDLFLIGEAESSIPLFFKYYDENESKNILLKNIADNVPSAYVPAFYEESSAFYDTETRVKRAFINTPELSSTVVYTPNTIFENTYLIEIGRGCLNGCRFCSAGYIYRPPRFQPLSNIKERITEACQFTNRFGLVGASVSDYPYISELCAFAIDQGIKLSFSSFRADGINKEILEVLKQSGIKTATIAPDAGSERMRKIINKKLKEDDILNAVENIITSDIPNIKLYFMIGLPYEDISDIYALIDLVKKIKENFLISSRPKKRIGNITVSINPFIPKPFTPFQWIAMDSQSQLKIKINIIRKNLNKIPNVTLNFESLKMANIQALLSRGDRNTGKAMLLSIEKDINISSALKQMEINPEFYVTRNRNIDETLPWDFIDHGINKSFLAEELKAAKDGRETHKCIINSCKRCGIC